MAIKGTNGDDMLDGTSGNDMMYGYDGDDTLNGGDGNDVLYGGNGGDTLFGGNGNDQMSGGDGDDYMEGGDGNDTYYVEDIGDVVIEFGNEGIDTVVSYLANYRIGANVERLTIAEGAAVDSAGRSNGSGNDLDNTIKGNSGSNSLHGYAGNDSMYGNGGDDILDGGDGNDIIDGGDGIDIITFGQEASLGGHGVTVDLSITARQNTGYGLDAIRNIENIDGTAFDDILSGNADNNKIKANGGDDTVRGRAGDDDITLGAGADKVLFEAAGAANGYDRVRGFESGVDQLVFKAADGYDINAGFETITGSGVSASLGHAQFVYNETTQILYYDADGAGSDAIAIASFNENPPTVITAGDIVLI